MLGLSADTWLLPADGMEKTGMEETGRECGRKDGVALEKSGANIAD